MKRLIEYITESFKNEELYHENIKISWEKCGKKIANKWKEIPSSLKEYMKQIVFSDIENFYKNTPRKRNVVSACDFRVKLEITPKDLKSPAHKLMALYNKVGMNYWMLSLINDRSGIVTGSIIGSSDSRASGTDINKIKFKENIYNSWSWKYSERLSGNGYNHLPGKLQEEYRDKFLECITDTEIEVVKKNEKNFNIGQMVPCIDITYTAVYDKAKVNKLIDEINNNEELMKYADILAATNKGIDAYYSSKRSGDYTGD